MKIKLRFTVALLLAQLTLFAQDSERKHSIGLYQNFTDYNVQLLDGNWTTFDSSFSHSTRIAYQRLISPTWMFNIGVSNGFILGQSIDDEYVEKAFATGVDGQIILRLNNGRIIKQEALVGPFLSFGYQADYINKYKEMGNSPWSTHSMYGLGVNIPLSNRTHIQLQSSINQKLGDDFNTSLQYRMGITQSLGRLEDKPALSDPNLDSDGDGIADKDDMCPGRFGVAEKNGCPIKNNPIRVNPHREDSLIHLNNLKKSKILSLEQELDDLQKKYAAITSDTKASDTVYVQDTLKDLEIESLKSQLDSLLTVNKRLKSLTPTEIPKAKTPADRTLSEDQNFYVVTISAVSKAGAEEWLVEMRKEFSSSIIIPQADGLYRVGVFAGKDIKHANNLLKRAKEVGFETAWLYIK